jgi:hypothetical protein
MPNTFFMKKPFKAVLPMPTNFKEKHLTARKIKENIKHTVFFKTVLGIQIRNRIRIRMFLGLLDPDPLVRDTDPDPVLDTSLFS